ncbi:hypothetical protein [Capnocytophaga endodontalis]|uniref:Uncharacterized protein n=1 Tax=Capnocytophaga endodontalis TaxID=2708117 RepID=A0A1Z4BKK7_9FLAO|nr:hypothetical protein [Capnocytophaga endodontalis]ASF41805.1 hypothetical protein CBG49_01160 [Capnocytophaga endodontalis]
MKDFPFEEEKEYIAMVEASKCRTYIGFIEALNDAFFIHTGQEPHINDTMWHIFSSDVGHRKIKILFMRSGSLKKLSVYHEITADLEQWKRYWEAENPKNQLEWEFC